MFKELPRFVGFPNQVFCSTKFAFDSLMKTFNGKAPLFVSTYAFKNRTTPIVDSLVFDIDSYFSLRIPYDNTMKLKVWSEKNNIPYTINYSGGKGFHFFMIIKDIIPETDITKQTVRDKIYSVQKKLVEMLGVEAIDYPTIGRLRWLIRYPTSKYVRFKDGKAECNGNYCRHLEPEEFDRGLKYISTLVSKPGEVPRKPSATKSLDDIIKLLPRFRVEHRAYGNGGYIQLNQPVKEAPTLQAVGLPCLKEIAKNKHPGHQERIELVSWLKMMNYSDRAIVSFIKGQGWRDFKYAVTSYQVSTVLPRYPKCQYLRRNYEKFCEKCSLRRG